MSADSKRRPLWHLVAGARPNFMKIAPLVRAVESVPVDIRPEIRIVHTGQHYDDAMSASFFRQLAIPDPAVNLGIGSGTHAEQVGRTMIAFEGLLRQERPDWVVVVGDVNAAMACSLTARKEGVRVAHVEAGLRSGDWSMPEEINRVVTDRVSSMLFTTDEFADRNLDREGVEHRRVVRTGNVMIDSLDYALARLPDRAVEDLVGTHRMEGLAPRDLRGRLVLLTLHRPSNVDDQPTLSALVDMLAGEPYVRHAVAWPLHPRTRGMLEKFALMDKVRGLVHVHLLEPLGYLDLVALLKEASLVMTDSGGLQEEACVLGVPCLTMRRNTERPVTLEENGGTNVLVGSEPSRVTDAFKRRIGKARAPFRPPLWDGKASERIVRALAKYQAAAK